MWKGAEPYVDEGIAEYRAAEGAFSNALDAEKLSRTQINELADVYMSVLDKGSRSAFGSIQDKPNHRLVQAVIDDQPQMPYFSASEAFWSWGQFYEWMEWPAMPRDVAPHFAPFDGRRLTSAERYAHDNAHIRKLSRDRALRARLELEPDSPTKDRAREYLASLFHEHGRARFGKRGDIGPNGAVIMRRADLHNSPVWHTEAQRGEGRDLIARLLEEMGRN